MENLDNKKAPPAADPVVPVARAIASRDALRTLGHDVDWHEYPIEHTVSIEEIRDLQAWLLRVLG